MSKEDFLEGEEVLYTKDGVDQELDSDWEWSLTAPTEPNQLYGLYEPDSKRIESVFLREDGCLSDGRKPEDIDGIWFEGIPEDQPFHIAMVSGPPQELIDELVE